MYGPPLVGWLLVGVSFGTGVLCLLRARTTGPAGRCGRRTACAEGVMGLGMTLMAVPAAALDERVWGPPLLALVFGGLAVRTLAFARGECHRTHHTVEAVAMVYMVVAMAWSPDATEMTSMAGMDHAGMGVPAVNDVLLCYFTVYIFWAGRRVLAVPAALAPAAGGSGGKTAVWGVFQPPQVGAACRLSLAIGMLVMLLMM